MTEDVAASADDASVWEYETLRTHALNGSTLSRPAGLVVLLRHGVAAWRARPREDASAASPAPLTAAPGIVNDRHAALVPVLVNMVLGADLQVRL